ncbi:MAG: nucleoside-diphosphate kinase [candidate division WOR-3 bacterium]|nr:nucleoside-diphosphate kinase [candidate division WOR-3 bacterium]
MEKTLFLIKPDGVKRRLIGALISSTEDLGLSIVKMKMVHLTLEEAREFYCEHRGKEFFNKLVKFITRDRIVALELEGKDAIQRLRDLVGATDPNDSAPGTIRAAYGLSKTENTVHASDSKDSAKREIEFFFEKEVE